MNIATFEDYLRARHAKEYQGLDDDMEDNYDSWILEMDVFELIEFGNDYGDFIRGKETPSFLDALKNALKP